MSKNLYCVYDCKLREVSTVFLLEEHTVCGFLTELASSVDSPYLARIDDFKVYFVGCFEDLSLDLKMEFHSLLSQYVDNERVNLQRIVKTLNFLPTGYFKMPIEKQKEIEDEIKLAISDYVQSYIDFDKIDKEEVLKK